MNDLYTNYPWVPFFQELAIAILKYKDNRSPLLAWLKRDLSGLKNREKKTFWFCEKITDPARNDIDPFSIIAILCKKYNYATLERILPIFKDFFQIQVDASSSDWGLITTNTTRFFFTNDEDVINSLWNIFEKALYDKDFEEDFNHIQAIEKFSNYYLTYCLSWICPDKYLGLSQNIIAFIRSYIVINLKLNYDDYKQIIKQANRLIEKKTIACNSLVQLTEIAQSEHMMGKIWYVPGTPQDLKDGKIALSKSLLRELSTNYSILGDANPNKDTLVLYSANASGNNSSLCLHMWGRFLPHKIKMKSDMLSYVEWHSYGKQPINYDDQERHEGVFYKVTTTELLDLLRIESDFKVNIMDTKHQKRINDLVAMLEVNKNLILTGAPGTGKTFMAKEIAKALILKNINSYIDKANADPMKVEAEKKIIDQLSKNACKMVLFHPSYDYSDFVEGLRPTMKTENQLGFKRVDGVFKDFCVQSFESAIVKKKSDNKGSLLSNSLFAIYCDGYYEAIKNILNHDGYFSYFMDNYSTNFSVEELGGILSKDADPAWAYTIKFEDIQWVDDVYESYQIFEYLIKIPFDREVISSQAINIYRRNCPSQDEIEKAISNHDVTDNADWKKKIESFDIAKVAKSYMALFSWVVYYAKSHYEVQYLPTVFIIDEINRGEVSKIFGELFFSIEPGYRGEYDENGNDNKVQTQYQNLIPKEGDDNFDPQNADIFRNGFYVPENVYIIGTMNDIDRSVESMDFAMRRRFAFEEVTAKESYQNMIEESKEFSDEEKTEIKERMFALNGAILKPELRLGEAYQIGAAYFRKYLSYKHLGMEQAFKMLWNYHLKGLLFEYLRGNQNAKAYLDELEKAYNKMRETNDETDKDNG